MAHNESRGHHGTILIIRELLYLAVGCALLLAIHWPKEKVFIFRVKQENHNRLHSGLFWNEE